MVDVYLISLDVTDVQQGIVESFYFGTDEGYPFMTKSVSSAKQYNSANVIELHTAITKIFHIFQAQLTTGLFQIPVKTRNEILGDCSIYVYEAEALASQMRHSMAAASASAGSKPSFEICVNKIEIKRTVAAQISSDFCDPEVQRRQQRYQEYLKLKEEFGDR